MELDSCKKSISKKLFLITFTLFIVFFSFSMIFQILYFDTFYANRKKNALMNNLSKFMEETSYNVSNDESLYNAIAQFESSNVAKVGILTPEGEIKYVLDKNSEWQKKNITILANIFRSLSSDPNFIPSLQDSDKPFCTIMQDRDTSLKHIVCIAPFSLYSKNDSVIMVLSSFQTINEASSIIKQFYFYVFIFLLFFCLVLSFIYSNMISKPLIKITNIAKRMSQLDFSSKCQEDREDEIGTLGKSINILSANLSSSLSELRAKNEKLTKDIERERKLEKMRKEFIAGASHELKTPLGIIEGYAEGLKDNIVEGESRDIYLDTIIDEADKMNKLVMDMLELSKLEAENMTLKMEPFNIRELTSNILIKHKNNFEKHNLHLSFILNNISEESEIVIGDSFRIESVIENFVTNAIKYSPENEHVNVSLSEKDNTVVFSIENTGTHIKPEDLEKVWVQFYRVDKARSRAQGSNGLGLSIVKTILTQHRSVFGVMNTKDGVLFYFSLNKYTKDK